MMSAVTPTPTISMGLVSVIASQYRPSKTATLSPGQAASTARPMDGNSRFNPTVSTRGPVLEASALRGVVVVAALAASGYWSG
jgi:hypothetical protein